MRVVPFKVHFLIRFRSDHNKISMTNAKIDALYAGSLRIKFQISALSNYTFYKGIYLSKALTCMKIFLYKQELLFVKETDTFGHIVV